MVLVIAVPLAWLRTDVKQAREQRIAVAALTKMGCVIRYDDADEHRQQFPNAGRFLSTSDVLQAVLDLPQLRDQFLGVQQAANLRDELERRIQGGVSRLRGRYLGSR